MSIIQLKGWVNWLLFWRRKVSPYLKISIMQMKDSNELTKLNYVPIGPHWLCFFLCLKCTPSHPHHSSPGSPLGIHHYLGQILISPRSLLWALTICYATKIRFDPVLHTHFLILRCNSLDCNRSSVRSGTMAYLVITVVLVHFQWMPK